MLRKHKAAFAGLAAAAVLASGSWVGTAVAREVTVPAQKKLAKGDVEVKQLLLLMDKDDNGKVSKQEFLTFMEAEFDRLDKDKSGELDVKELTQSWVRTRSPIGR
jgi:Ca2+-binding EF-hand superfamily protein